MLRLIYERASKRCRPSFLHNERTPGNTVIVSIPDNRTYHFQAEDEADQRAWMSVLVNCKERALLRAFDASGKAEAGSGNPSLVELQQAVIRCVMRLPGNDQCCDCSSQNGNTNIVDHLVVGRPFSDTCQVRPLHLARD